MGVELAIASLALGAYSAYEAKEAREDATKSREEAQRKQTASEQVQMRQQRRQKLREERIRRAQILQRAETMGVGASSGEAGAIGSLATQTSSNLGYQQGQTKFVQSINQDLSSAAKSETSAENFAGLSSLSFQTFQATGGFDTIFKDKPKGP